jgi:hypothetical protein
MEHNHLAELRSSWNTLVRIQRLRGASLALLLLAVVGVVVSNDHWMFGGFAVAFLALYLRFCFLVYRFVCPHCGARVCPALFAFARTVQKCPRCGFPVTYMM